MARPRRVSDEEVLSSVRRAVLEHGPSVSMDHIAAELGVTPPAIFRRFGSRNELLIAALKPDEEPSFLAALAAQAGARPLLAAGRIADDADTSLFAEAVSLTALAGSTTAALTDPARWLRVAGAALARTR